MSVWLDMSSDAAKYLGNSDFRPLTDVEFFVAYAQLSILLVAYYSQNYASIIYQGLVHCTHHLH